MMRPRGSLRGRLTARLGAAGLSASAQFDRSDPEGYDLPMALVRVFSPHTEPEVLLATSILEAHEIPVFVHNRGIGSLLPGIQINAYNSQSVLVPEECVEDAVELLRELRQINPENSTVPLRSKLRILMEGILFGWFVPGVRAGRASSSDPHEP